MWTLALLLALAGLTSADYGWKPGSLYYYNVESRTTTGIHQVGDQYSGTLIKGVLQVYVESDNKLVLQVQDLKYADFNQYLSQGWDSEFPQGQLNFKPLPVKNSVFEFHQWKGLVQKIVVEEDTPNWELNIFKGFASQFQVDTQAQNSKSSKRNIFPQGEQSTAYYKTYEETVSGIYETIYTIIPLADYVLQSQPELAPLPHLQGDGQFYDVVKSKNFSSSNKHPVYHYGFNGHEGWYTGTNQMENFFSRESLSRIVLSGSLDSYTIQSSVTTERIIAAPHMYNTQQGMVATRVNFTLYNLENNKKAPAHSFVNPKTVNGLTYQFGEGNAENGDSGESSSSSSETSESSSSSSEESGHHHGLNAHKRQSRSTQWSSSSSKQDMRKPIQGDYSSSSSSSSSEDSSISSSEEYLSPQPQLNEAPKVEFLPDYLFHQQHDSAQTVEQIVRVSRQIGQFLQYPSYIPQNQVLTYYSILSHLAGAANSQQLEQATEKLYYPEEKIQESTANQEAYHYYRSWQAFRDGVAQAGTGPALVNIFSWIKSGKVSGNEAAQLVAVLPRAARYPTTEYMNYFFELVKSNQVQNQRFLNDSAILSFADLVRRSQVDKDSAQHRYPIHLSGAQSQNHRQVVAEKYIPYFRDQLQKAYYEKDPIKTQVYSRALSNTAHPKVWEVLEPYLEGKYNISHFQRLVMIAYLGEMINVHPNTARAVLFRIYQNEGDVPEVRVAAVMQLMKTNPPAQLLQYLAEQTHHDHSEHVNAAVKSAIESAANGEFYAYPEFVKNARSAANYLTSKHYGYQHSQNLIMSYQAKEHHNLQYDHHLSFIKAYDGTFPSSVLYNLQRKIGGSLHEPQTFFLMSSSSGGLLNLLFGQFTKFGGHQKQSMAHQKQGKQSQYSYQKIYEDLNGEYDEPLQVEGNFFSSFFGSPRFFAFDNHTIEQIPQYINQFMQKYNRGFKFHETKYYSPYSVEMGFALASGFPFSYSYTDSALFYVDSYAKGQFQFEQGANGYYQLPFTASTNGTYQFTWASQKQGRMGFTAYHSNQKHIAAVEKTSQFFIPAVVKVQFNGLQNSFQATVQPYSANNEQQKVFQHNTTVYTAINNYYDIKPYAQGSNVKQVSVGPRQTYKSPVARDYTGHDFQLEAESENYFYDFQQIYKAFKTQNYDYFSSFFFHDLTHSIANNYYAVSYNPKTSTPEKAYFNFYYNYVQQAGEGKKSARQLKHNMRSRRMHPGVGGNMAQPSSVATRAEELLANAYSGIQDAHAYIFDASASFAGQQSQGQFVFTAAYAESPVSEKSRFLAYVSGAPYQESKDAKPFKAAFQFNFKQPQVPVYNYREAYEADPTSYFDGQINFDNSDSSKIVFEGKFQQTEERKKYVSQQPYSVVCQQQMQQNNYIQPACRNASFQANALDKYDFTIKYQNVPQAFENAAHKFYSAIRYFGYPYYQEYYDGVQNEKGQLKFNFQFSEDFNYFNFSFKFPDFNSHFENVKLYHEFRPFFVQYPAYNQLYYYSPYYFYTKPYATCAVDANVVSTFNNKSYPISLGESYHVLAIATEPYYQEDSEESFENNYYYYHPRNFAVLAKETGSQKKEVQVVLGDDAIALKPSGSEGVTVSVNGEIFPTYANKESRWENSENQFVAYSLPGQSNVVLYFGNHSFQVYYDGYRVALSFHNSYRNRVRGLCGTFDGEPVNDFTTSGNCVVRDYQQFTASYAIPSSPYQSSAKYQNGPCYPKEVVYADVISDAEAGRGTRRTSLTENEIKGQSRRSQQGCSVYKVQIVKDGGRSCFSLKPQVACSSSCKANRKIEKHIDFHCAPDSDKLTGHWLRMVKLGASPDFSQKTANSRMRVMLPESCIAS